MWGGQAGQWGLKKREREEKAAWASDHKAALHHHQPAESIKEPPTALCSTVLMTSLCPISPAKCSSWTSARPRRGGGSLRGEPRVWECVCVTSHECRRLCPTGSVDSSSLPAAPCPPPTSSASITTTPPSEDECEMWCVCGGWDGGHRGLDI